MVVLLFSSCATLTTRKCYKVKVSTDLAGSTAQILDSTYSFPAVVKLPRSKDDLHIKLSSDSFSKDFTVKASPNRAFLYGNLVWTIIAPAAYGIDFTNQKRFYYGENIFLSVNDTATLIRPEILQNYRDYWLESFNVNKGQITLNISVPYCNIFNLQPYGESRKFNTGFWGISAGIDYFYKADKFLSLTASKQTDFFLPFLAPIDLSGTWEYMDSKNIRLTDNFRFRRFTAGYGLSFSENIWQSIYYDRWDSPPPIRDDVTKTSYSVGFTLDFYHQITDYFFAGMLYNPSIVTLAPNTKIEYQHLISLDFKWKIRLKK